MNKNTYTSVKLTKGEMNVYDFGTIRLHAYKTNDLIDDEVFVVEKDGVAVIIESPCFFDNMEYMNLRGATVFLEATEETLFNRLQAGKHTRPILMNKTDEELRMFISSALSVRMPCYRKARYRLPADRLESRVQIEEAVKAFRQLLQI